MLIGIEGGLGAGKTIIAVRYCLIDKIKYHKNIMCNIGLKNIDYEQVDVNKLLEYGNKNVHLYNYTVFIDELTVFVDCRTSTSKSNRIFSYLVLQSRKRNVDIYYTTQDLGMIDFRVVNHTPITVHAETIFDKKNREIKGIKKYTIIDRTNPLHPTMDSFVMDITKYYNEYDTDEIVQPLFNLPKGDNDN